MNKLYFNVVKQKITLDNCCRDTIVASKARKYVVANFQFDDPDWKDKKVTAIFRNSNVSKPYSQIIGADPELKSCECYVPWEVLDKKGTLSVSVSAGNLQTTISACVIIKESGYEEGETPEEPTDTVYQQILKELKIIEEQGVPEEVVESAVKKYLEEHPIEIDTYTKSQIDNKISTAVEEIRKIIPAPYDDTQIKADVKTLKEKANDTYTKQEVDNLIPEVPTKTSQLNNDSNFVSDENYNHTDNNYTTADKTKLDGLSNYDDTEIKETISQLNESIADIQAELVGVSDLADSISEVIG